MKLYLHTYEKNSPTELETGILEFKKHEGTIQDLHREIQEVLPGKIVKNISTTYKGDNFGNMLLSADFFFEENSDVYVEVEIPVKTEIAVEEIPKVFFETISKYLFYESDDKQFMMVTFELNGIGKHAKEKFEARFLDTSFELKIVDFNGKNYTFAVPKLSNTIIPEQSKWWTKDNKVIIKLKKFKKEDNWASLFKQKAIGDDS